MPTLVFDVRANHDTGVSRYGLSTLAATAPLLAEASWRVLVVAQPRQAERARGAVESLDFQIMCEPDEEGFVRHSPWLRELLTDADADLYYTSHYAVDRECPVPFVFTIHDLTRLRFPELSYTDTSFAERFGHAELNLVREELTILSAWDEPKDSDETFTRYFRALNRYLAQRAERVATVSDSTAHDVQALLGVEPCRLALVPCGVDTNVFHRRDASTVQSVRNKLGLAGSYLMFVGLAHPNKRFPWLVESLLRVRHRLPRDARLVAVGGHAEQVSHVAKLLAEHGAKDFVVFTGYVSEADLAALYSGAAALVTASVNEGNNLPPLEAMACGCQVIATDIPPLRETLGESAAFYDPNSGAALAAYAEDALGGCLSDRARVFHPPTWSQAGHRLFEALSAATQRPDQARRIRA
ncbi:MAG: glycosyltransferase family 4 protein [Pseudonocardiaceae bacterium]